MHWKSAEIILPLPIDRTFAYLLPDDLDKSPEIGKRVIVPFGKTKTMIGVICKLLTSEDPTFQNKLKSIIEIIDERPILTKNLIDLYFWISDYYLCTPGEVLKAAIPSGLKMEKKVYVTITKYCNLQDLSLSDSQYLILEALSIKNTLSLTQLEKIVEVKNVESILKPLKDKGYIMINEYWSEPYQPKKIKFLKINECMNDAYFAEDAYQQIKNAPAQEKVLQILHQQLKQKPLQKENEILSKAGTTSSTIKGLIQKGLVEIVYIEEDRVNDHLQAKAKKNITLNDEQKNAVHQIIQECKKEQPETILLHGITGSGKTQVYIESIKHMLSHGKTVLYLLPEIGLTQQIIDKLRSEFGHLVGVYHSRFNNKERIEIWNKVLNDRYKIVIGVRSAIFMPFNNLGMIIVDEEHDSSFKQQEPNPRYNARDVAVYYGKIHHLPVVLGSATPSIESYFNAIHKKYKLLKLTKRAVANQLPDIEFIDMKTQVKEKRSTGLFSDILIDEITKTLKRKEQVILFNQRRAYSHHLICSHCGFVPRCLYCDISLAYHKNDHKLKCHYCGYTDNNTEQCSLCKQYELQRLGIGTEKIEEQLAELFPMINVARMDLDTTRGKHALAEIIQDFENHKVDILVGTQMVTKGLDFENATLAVVIQADKMLNFPDFRSHEYTYQLLTQFSGRAGRSTKKGTVMIQTMDHEHSVLKLLNEQYELFYNMELGIRKHGKYPPYTRLIRIELQHKERYYLENQGAELGKILKGKFKSMLLGPEYPLIARLKNHFRLQMLLKIPRSISVHKVKEVIKSSISHYYQYSPNKTLRIIIDVDPR